MRCVVFLYVAVAACEAWSDVYTRGLYSWPIDFGGGTRGSRLRWQTAVLLMFTMLTTVLSVVGRAESSSQHGAHHSGCGSGKLRISAHSIQSLRTPVIPRSLCRRTPPSSRA